MTTNTYNPLGLEDKLYSVKEFAFAVRTKFGANDNLPDSILVDIFLKKYPVYSCKIKTSPNSETQPGCSCC